MREIIRGLHDIWCAVTNRCRITPHDDPLLTTLQHHEKAALREAKQLRDRRHWYEQELLSRIERRENDHA